MLQFYSTRWKNPRRLIHRSERLQLQLEFWRKQFGNYFVANGTLLTFLCLFRKHPNPTSPHLNPTFCLHSRQKDHIHQILFLEFISRKSLHFSYIKYYSGHLFSQKLTWHVFVCDSENYMEKLVGNHLLGKSHFSYITYCYRNSSGNSFRLGSIRLLLARCLSILVATC